MCAAAMLTVEDPTFWEGVEPVKFGVLPRLQDSVTVIGYDLVPRQAFLLPAHIATTYAVTCASHRCTLALHRGSICITWVASMQETWYQQSNTSVMHMVPHVMQTNLYLLPSLTIPAGVWVLLHTLIRPVCCTQVPNWRRYHVCDQWGGLKD